MEQNDDLGRALEAIDDEARREAEIGAFRANFERTKNDFLRELEGFISAVNETPTETYQEALENTVRKYFDALLTFQQAELKKIVLEKAKRWDISTEQILKELLENYG